MSIGKRRGEAVMIVIMGVMMLGGIILWLTRGEFHMMPMHGGHGGGNTHSIPADDHQDGDEAQDQDTTSPPGSSPDGREQ